MRSQEQDITATERQRQALELRKAGVSYTVIADKLGYRSGSGAHAAVGAALKKTLQEPADDLRTLELERLDVAHLAIWQQVRSGNQGAIDRYLKIAERRAKLLGLDAPQRIAPTTPDGNAPYTIEVNHVSYRDGLISESADSAE